MSKIKKTQKTAEKLKISSLKAELKHLKSKLPKLKWFYYNSLAENIGIYFNGCNNEIDCGCCGDRWGRAYDDGTDLPEIYSNTYKNISNKIEVRKAGGKDKYWADFDAIFYPYGTIK